MLKLIETLWRGNQARMHDAATDRYAVELIEQKIRDAQTAFRAAKGTLATLIQRERVEARALETLDARITDLTTRAEMALRDGREYLAQDAATSLADLENERQVRRDTLDRLQAKCARLQHNLDRTNRRIIDLRQGAIGARAVDRERRAQASLGASAATPHMAEAEELIARVMGADDPFEHDQIVQEIDAGLNGSDVTTRLGAAGYGAPTRIRADDVLARLRANRNATLTQAAPTQAKG
ncbi:PspA/IM30 family protein [Monaibacterium marinum]|nr:PspA/IM30 family protein [Monaibacterium marinum]